MKEGLGRLHRIIVRLFLLLLLIWCSDAVNSNSNSNSHHDKSYGPEATIDAAGRAADDAPVAKKDSGADGVDSGGGGEDAAAVDAKAVSVDDPGVPRAMGLQRSKSLELEGSAAMSVKMQYIIIALVCAVVAVIGVIIAVTCYCKFRRSESGNFAGQRQGNGYASYGVTGPVSKNSFQFHEPGDRKLAQSAQMYHYQYQKQQMIDMEKANGEVRQDATDEENEAEDEDDVVYQTCGLATSDDLQIPNPMFKAEEGSKAGVDGDRGSDDAHKDGPSSKKSD